MASISLPTLAEAVRRVERMSFDERVRLGDQVHAAQPNLFFSVLVQQRFGATMPQVEVLLNILFVFHEAMKIRGSVQPIAYVTPAQHLPGEKATGGCDDLASFCVKTAHGQPRAASGAPFMNDPG